MSIITCSQGHPNPPGAQFCSRCGVSLQGNTSAAGVTQLQPESSGLSPGTRLRDRYIIVRTIGQGGFGRTYLATDTGRFNEPVAIKELMPFAQGTSSLQKAEELFQREAAILYKLQHPQIPRFWEFFRQGQQLFLVQDFIEGETYQSLLTQRIQQGKCFSETETWQFLRNLLLILSYLHHQGVIHRDISPDNIICRTQDQQPVLIDLGGVKQIAINVAYQLGETKPFSGINSTRLGKIGYAPDEQIRLGMVAPYSDLYALAVTAIVLLTGKQPQALIDPKTMNWIWDRQVQISPKLRGILHRMLAPQPAQRFQSAEEILQIIDNTKAFQTQVVPGYISNVPPNSATVFSNNSGQGGLFDNSIKVPDEVLGWNWGAFLLPGIWCLSNRVWIGLLAWSDPTLIHTIFIPWTIAGLVLGIKGNEWAWKSRQWRSIAAFKRHQRLWAIAGFLIIGFIVILLLMLGLFLSALLHLVTQ